MAKTPPSKLLSRRLYVERQRQRDPEYAEKVRAYHKQYRAMNREKLLAADRQRYRENARAYVLKKHGLSEPEYEDLLKEQENACAICKGEADGRWKRFCVDHDHKTGEVRGLLCSRCNLGIGYMRDNPGLLRRAIKYLSKAQGS